RQKPEALAPSRWQTPSGPKRSPAEDCGGVLPQDLPLDVLAEAQGAELFDVAPHRHDSWRGPVRPPETLAGERSETRHVLQECFRWDAGEVEPDVRVPAGEEHRGLPV